MKEKNRRRKLIISKLQWHMILSIMGLIAGVAGALVVLTFVVVRKYASLLPITPEVGNQLIAKSVFPVVIIVIILFILSFWAVLLISHKLYGPLYRCGKYIEQLIGGEKAKDLKFRKDDAVSDLKDILG
jgi:hypothetical protein